MPTNINKPIAMDSTAQELITKVQLVEDALTPTVQSDWTEADPNSSAYIKNKPKDFWGDKTISGNPISLKTGTAQSAKDVKITMFPIQSLNGYDSPWPAGGGVQLWDEVWESGYIGGESGSDLPQDGRIRSKNYISVIPNTVYYAKCPSVLTLRFYDENKNFIPSANSSVDNATFTIPQGAYYMRFYLLADAYANNICINISNASVNGKYYPYSNICPITGRQSVSLDGCGKNLFGGTITQLNAKNILSSGVLLSAGTYTITIFWNDICNGIYIRNGVEISSQTIITQKYDSNFCTFTINEDTTVYVQGLCNNGISVDSVRIQYESGNQSTPYSQYTPNPAMPLTIPFGQTVYGGTLDVESGVLTVDRGYVDLGTLEWTTAGSGRHSTPLPIGMKSVPNNIVTNSICSEYKAYAGGIVSNNDMSFGVVNGNRVVINDSRLNGIDASDFKDAMNGVQLVYELATPTTIQLTPEEVQLLKDNNTIWTDGDSIELTYYANANDVTKVSDEIDLVQSCMGNNESIASKNYVVGDFLTVNHLFCKVTSPISQGSAIIIGTNVTQTTIDAELKLLRS